MSYSTTWGDFTEHTRPTASLVKKYFEGNNYGHSDCAQGLELAYAKAMIDVYGAEQWDKFDIALIEQIPQLLTEKPGGGTPAQMWQGDSGFIMNYPDYLDLSRGHYGRSGVSQGENLIKISQGRFWGYTDNQEKKRTTHSIDYFNRILRNDYIIVGGHPASGDSYPYWTGRISFIDVAKWTQIAFQDRNTNRRPRNCRR
jgi:hypothetical protein